MYESEGEREGLLRSYYTHLSVRIVCIGERDIKWAVHPAGSEGSRDRGQIRKVGESIAMDEGEGDLEGEGWRFEYKEKMVWGQRGRE